MIQQIRKVESISNLNELNLHTNKLKKIDSKTFEGLSELEELSLRDYEIEEIDVRSFENFLNLKKIDLNKNKLKKLDSDTFKGLIDLEELILNENEIDTIDKTLFVSLSNLKKLDLSKNKLKKIDSETFKLVIELEELLLKDNEIDEIANSSFESLSNLKKLNLSKNKINEINYKTFEGLTKLEELLLNDNKIQELNERSFYSLLNLKILELDNNKLKRFYYKTFKHLTILEVLLLSNNNIVEIFVRTLDEYSELYNLNFDTNKQEECDFNTLGKFTDIKELIWKDNKKEKSDERIKNILNLKKIDLSKNKLKKIHSKTFKGVTKLEELLLNDNEIDDIANSSFECFSNLKRLDLDNNKLKKINYGFSQLTILEVLSLKDNEIEHIDVGSFKNLLNLKKIDLSKNKLKKIDSRTFEGLIELEELLLNDNELVEIDKALLFGLLNLKILDLNNNKLKKIDYNTFFRLTKLEVLFLDNNAIEQIDVRSFENLLNIEKLNLSKNKLKKVDYNTFGALSQLEELLLNDNEIGHIDKTLIESLINLEKLDLHNNNLTLFNFINNNVESLDNDLISFQNLQVINLSYNNFSKIKIDFTKNIQKVIFLDLSSNLFEDFSNISITSYLQNINVDLRFNKIQSITKFNFDKAKDPKIKYDISFNPLSKNFINLLNQDSDYRKIFNIKKNNEDYIKMISFENDKENPMFSYLKNFYKWSSIEKFSILTGKNGIGKSSVLNYIQKTASDMLNRINNFTKSEYYNVTHEDKREIQDIFSNYRKFFDLLPIDIDNDMLNSESKLIIKKLYIPIIYRMHDTIRPINTPIMNIMKIINNFFRFQKENQFDRNLIEIFFLELNENNDALDTLILKNFSNKLEILNDHLKNRGFKYKIEENNKLIELVDEKIGIRIRSKSMSPGEQLKMLFYIWEFTLSRFRLPFTPFLLLDEPDAHLHPKAVHEFIEILEKLSEAGAQIIMTTHNPTTVSFAKEESLFYMKENENKSITIHKAKSKADAIYELTENLVAVNIPFLTILVEGNDYRFYELVRQKLGNSYVCQFIFKYFRGCENIIDFFLSIQLDNETKEKINQIINDVNKSEPIITFITEQVQRKLNFDHFGIIDNDNYLEICSNNTIVINKYYETRDKNVYNLLRHSLENYVLDPISLYFYLKYLNSSNNKDFQINCDENSLFKELNHKIDSVISDPNRLRNIKSVDDFVHWDIGEDDKVKILENIVKIISELIINYLINFLKESMSLKPRLFYDKHISNQTPLFRYVKSELSKKTTRKQRHEEITDPDFIWITFFISEINKKEDVDEFKRLYDIKKKIINKKGLEIEKIKGNETIKDKSIKIIIDNPPKIPSIIDEKSFDDFSKIYLNLIKKIKEIIRTYNLKESEYTEDINGIDDLLNYYYEINKYTDIKDIDISILHDFSKKNDNDILNDNTTVTKKQLNDYIDFKYKLDKKLVELIKKDLEETIECHFVYKDDKEIKIDYPKVFYCLRGHNLEETVCKMFFVKDSFPRNKKNEVIYTLVKEILKEDGLFEKCGYLIPNELKEIFNQINTIKTNLIDKEKNEKQEREKENTN